MSVAGAVRLLVSFIFFFLKDGDITHWFLGSVDFSVSILIRFFEVKHYFVRMRLWDESN